MAKSVVVVGGGIFGLTAAQELQQRGWQATVFERGDLPHPDASTTDISKLIRADYGADHFYRDKMRQAFVGWEAWNRRLPRPLWHQTGMLVWTTRPLEPGGFEADSLAAIEACGLPVRRWDRADGASFPQWSGIVDGYFSHSAGYAESGEVLRALAAWAREEGVQVHTGVGAVALDADEPAVWVQGQKVAADRVVVATGAFVACDLPELADHIHAVGQPVWHLGPLPPAVWGAPAFLPWAGDIARTGWYGFPLASTGVLKIAHHGFGHRVSPQAPRVVPGHRDADLRAFLAQHLAPIADSPIVSRRLCLYADSIDGDFWVDAVPGRPGVVVASGGSGHAFKFAPILGAAVADAVEGRAVEARWAWRQTPTPRWEAARAGGKPHEAV